MTKTKKPLKKSSEIATKTEEKHIKVQPVAEGVITVAFSQEELTSLTHLMGVMAQTFESLAMQAAQLNDEATFTVLSARHKLSSAYATRLLQFLKLGEPSSRDVH